MRQDWVRRYDFEKMVDNGEITDNSTLAAYALLLMAERREQVAK